LIAELVRRGYQVIATAPDIDSDLSERISALGAQAINLPLSRSGLSIAGDLRYAFQLYRLIKNSRVEFVIGYTIKPNIWGTIAAHLAKVPSAVMITGMGYAFIPGRGLKRRIAQLFARSLYRVALTYADRVIFQNQDDLDELVKTGILKSPEKARIVNGSGVDLAHYAPATLPDQPVFLVIARLLITKGIREFVSAVRQVRIKLPNARFIVAGGRDPGPDGLTKVEIASWANEGIEFVGEVPDVRPFIAAASVYVLPSYREGTPRSVLEAMAMGRPIITTDVPGCRQTVVNNVNGILVPAKDSDALAAAMVELGTGDSKRRVMGAASLEYVRKHYAVEPVNADLLSHLGLSGAEPASDF
jgi:glycosyltransferase involved in cell wall biosynthesis